MHIRRHKLIPMPSILLPLTLMLPVVECQPLRLDNSSNLDDQSAVRPLLKLWSERFGERSRNLVIVFDECNSEPIRFPRRTVQELAFSTRILTIDTCDVPNLDLTMNAGNCVLLLFVDVLRIRRILVSPHFSTFWRPENMYVLRQIHRRDANSHDETPYRFLRWALERLWRYRRVHRVVVSIGNTYVRFDPFKRRRYNERYPLEENRTHDSGAIRDVYVGLSVDDQEEISRGSKGWYVLEERERFDGYPLRISAFETATMIKSGDGYNGIDGAFLREVCKMMNVTPVFRTSTHGFGWGQNGVYVGTLADIVYRRADVTFNEFFVKDYLTRDVDTAMYFTCDHLCLIVPKAPHIPEYLAIVRTFSQELWIIILATHVLIALTYRCNVRNEKVNTLNVGTFGDCDLIQDSYRPVQVWKTDQELSWTRASQNYSVQRSVNDSEYLDRGEHDFAKDLPADELIRTKKKFYSACLLNLAGLTAKSFMHLVQPLRPARPRFSERLVLICSLIMGLVLNGIFTSKLTSNFSKLSHFEDIHTLEELDKSGLPILTNSPDLFDDALSNDDSPAVQSLRMKMKYVNDSEMFRRLLETKDAAIFRRKAYLQLRSAEKNKKKVHVIEECPKLYTIAPLVTKGSPFVERINTIIGRLHNGGFYDKWFQEISSRIKERRPNNKQNHQKLTMKYLGIPFAILFVGLFISLIAFACECAGYHE